MLFKKVADHILALDNLHSFNSKDCSQLLWAFAKAKELHPRLFDKVADHILALDNLHSFNSKECSQLLWAFATADMINLPLFRKVHDHATENIDFKSLDEIDRMNLGSKICFLISS